MGGVTETWSCDWSLLRKVGTRVAHERYDNLMPLQKHWRTNLRHLHKSPLGRSAYTEYYLNQSRSQDSKDSFSNLLDAASQADGFSPWIRASCALFQVWTRVT